MFAVTAAFSAVLITFSRATRERVEANEKLAVERAALVALDIDIPPGATNRELHDLYVRKVQQPTDASAGAYRLVENDKTVAYAVPFTGRGFWDTISGFVGVKAEDRRTITGFAVYEQRETPGLGARITEPEFKQQFDADKRLADEGRPLTFKREDAATGPTEINAITGATQTCTRLERMLNDRLAEWRAEMEKASEPKTETATSMGRPTRRQGGPDHVSGSPKATGGNTRSARLVTRTPSCRFAARTDSPGHPRGRDARDTPHVPSFASDRDHEERTQ
jgi:Na+-transporting NADH:ubiquinone oxidoreductase subunit C